jgi:PPP family 3-phenylpropionic acid transporter
MDRSPTPGSQTFGPAETFSVTHSRSLRARLSTPMVRTSAFFFTLMGPSAISNIGLSLWLADRGISDARIGLVNAAPIVIVVLIGLSIGRIADRSANWRAVIVACSLFAALTSALLALTHSFWAIVLVWSLTIVPLLAMTPIADAAAIRAATKAGRSYGAIRVWGTVGFVFTIVVVGFAFQAFGVAAFVPALVAISMARLGFAALLPDFHPPSKSDVSVVPQRPFAVVAFRDIKQLMKPWFLAPVFASALLMSSHAAQNGFGPLIWKSENVPDWLIGFYLAIAPAAEVGAMAFSGRLLTRFPARLILLCCCLVGTVRWWGYVTPMNPVTTSLLQSLHLVTFGLGYVAIVVFANAWSHDSIGAQVQAFTTLARNAVSIATYATIGFLTAKLGAHVFYVASAMCAIGAVLCAWSLGIQPPAKHRKVPSSPPSGS